MTESIASVQTISYDFDRAYKAIQQNPYWPNPTSPPNKLDSGPISLLQVPDTIAEQVFTTMGGSKKITVELERHYDDWGFPKSRVVRETIKASGSLAVEKNVLVLENDCLYRNMPMCGAGFDSSIPVIGLAVETPKRKEVFVECNQKYTEVFANKIAQLAIASIKGH